MELSEGADRKPPGQSFPDSGGLLASIGVALLHRLYGLENHTSAVIDNDIRATDISRKEGCYEHYI